MKNNRDKARNWMARASKGVQSFVLDASGNRVNYGPARIYVKDSDGLGWIAEMCRCERQWLETVPDLFNAPESDWELVDDLARSEGQMDLQLDYEERKRRGYHMTKTVKYRTPKSSNQPISRNVYLPQMRQNIARAADNPADWWNETAQSRSDATAPRNRQQSWSSSSWK